MAEIGVIASVLTLTGAGAQLARSLYGICDDFRHAPRQIERFARKISLLADALQQVRDTIRANPDCYNEKGEQRIMIIVRSCRKDFYEIRHELGYRSTGRGSGRVRWLFKKERADELFRSLDSQTSALQIMTNVVGLAASLREQKKLQRQSAQQYSDLKTQSSEQHAILQRQSQEQHAELQSRLASMELLIRTFQEQRFELETAEKKSGADTRRFSVDVPDDYPGLPESYPFSTPPTFPPAYTPGYLEASRPPWPRPGSTGDLTYEDYPVATMNHPNPFSPNPYNTPELMPNYSSNSQVAKLSQHQLGYHSSDHRTAPGPTSNALLQVIPWTAPHKTHEDEANYRQDHANVFRHLEDNKTKHDQPQSRPTDIVRYLVEEYTKGPTEILDEMLLSILASDPQSYSTPQLNAPHSVKHPLGYDFNSDQAFNVNESAISSDQSEVSNRARAPVVESRGAAGLHTEGSKFLSALNKTTASFVWMRGNDNVVDCYSGRNKFYRFSLRHQNSKNNRSDKPSFTRIGKGWVQEDLLKAHHVPFCAVDGYWHIYKALPYAALEEMVVLSSGAFVRKMHSYGQEKLSQLASAPIFDKGSFYPPNLLSGTHVSEKDPDRENRSETYQPLYRPASPEDTGSDSLDDQPYTVRARTRFDKTPVGRDRIYERARPRYPTVYRERPGVDATARRSPAPHPRHLHASKDPEDTDSRQPEAPAMMPGSTGFILPYSAGRLLTANSWHEDDVRSERELPPEQLSSAPVAESVASTSPKASAEADDTVEAAPSNEPSPAKASSSAANKQQPPKKTPATPPKAPRPVKVESESSGSNSDSIEEASDGEMDLYE